MDRLVELENPFFKGEFMKKFAVVVFLLLSSSAFAEDIYRLRATIGEHVFSDIFTYDGCIMPREVKGSITVPGVFTAPLEDGKCSYNWNGEHVSFKIKARENNEEYYVHYSLTITNNSLGGVMRKDGEIIGTIQGELIFRGNE